ncbi:alpha N-terminal protein methyltransferase 1-like isoform X3 [Prosopis cineraria]|uniref:alpha N-terminal protein methyltransferase 1-like isoform X3 n=1 Tax=Prosopis cineraria TaxID=364024 RepID=UPI00240EA20C|nr:alpha N-terminal protein methyltransferase 1-like isoform X3 [Prosopis cineraria]
MAEETNEISDKRPTGWGSLPFLIDLLEPVSHFVEAVRETLTSGNQMDSDIHKAVNFYCVPLQDFTPDTQIHDIIWIQWCIGHLTDEDFVSFFKRAIVGLKPGGFVVLKENSKKGHYALVANLSFRLC